jgi:hypothetical protein
MDSFIRPSQVTQNKSLSSMVMLRLFLVRQQMKNNDTLTKAVLE